MWAGCDASQPTPGVTAATYAARRAAVAKRLPSDTMLLLPSAARQFVYGIVPYPYRACSRLRHLTGVAERGATLALCNSDAGGDAGLPPALYLAPRDRRSEVWDGPRLGAGRDVADWLQIDVRPSTALLAGVALFLRRGGRHVALDAETHVETAEMVEEAARSVGRAFEDVHIDVPSARVDAPRLVKDAAELALMRRACDAIAGAINDSMGQLCAKRDGFLREADVAAVIKYSALRRGAHAIAFPPIAAGGHNGTVLHYMDNDDRVRADQLLFVDAGCEVFGYCSDVSRVWPVSGVFTTAQRELYDMVLDVHRRALALVVPGHTIDDIHMRTVVAIADGLKQLGFFPNIPLDKVLREGIYANYFPHATSHYLGLDLHDTHSLGTAIPLQRNMVITVEPGVYIPPNDQLAPERFRGIGFRVEDDVAVRDDNGPEVLSANAIIEADDIERHVGSATNRWHPQ